MNDVAAVVCPTCGQTFPGAAFCPVHGVRLVEPRSTERVGVILAGRFRIVRKVGEGGMGHVFEAEHAFIQKKVAIKLLRPEVAADPDAVRRLEREAHTTSGIGHCNIVQIEDFGHADDGAVYLAMEWLDGEPLDAIVARGPVDQATSLLIASHVTAGVAAAHARGVIHRDLKPANIFIVRAPSGELRAKVIDFGIARLAAGDSNLTQAGAFLGTPHFIAPEQALGEVVDFRADVYAVGVILYQLFTGTLPFKADSVMAVLNQHASRPPEPPRKRAPDRAIPVDVETLILRCMAKDPAGRYQTMQALHDDIEAVRGGRALPAPPPVVVADHTDDEPPRRSRWAPVLAIAGVLIAGGGVALYLGGKKGATTPITTPAAPVDAAVARPDATVAVSDERAWTHRASEPRFDYSVTVTPRPIRAGVDASYRLAISTTAPEVKEAIAAGRLNVRLTFEHYKETHHKTHHDDDPVRPLVPVDADGRANLTTLLAREGKYHVLLELLADGSTEPIATTKFDVCVGADPDAPANQLVSICPRLNDPTVHD